MARAISEQTTGRGPRGDRSESGGAGKGDGGAPPRSGGPGRRGEARLTTEVARLFPRQGQWTEEDYFALPERTRIIELSDGKLVVPDMATFSHQYAVGELFALLRSHVREHRSGTVAMAPLRVRLWPGQIREPDVVFLSREHADRCGEEFWGVPDLV